MSSTASASQEGYLRVEVAYARPDVQVLEPLILPPGATVEAAIRASGLLERFPEIDLARDGAGIFSRPVALDAPLRDGDRVEIYRPLQADPKDLRRQRARRQRRGRR